MFMNGEGKRIRKSAAMAYFMVYCLERLKRTTK
jgi:hypothetical protein